MWGDGPHPIYLQDGTFFEKSNAAAPGVQVLATYAANGEIAALVAPYGKGKVGVEGPHAGLHARLRSRREDARALTFG